MDKMKAGAPQASVFGPILYKLCIYVSDISESLFAEDTIDT